MQEGTSLVWRKTLISMQEGTLPRHFISMEEGTLLVCRKAGKAGKAGEGSNAA